MWLAADPGVTPVRNYRCESENSSRDDPGATSVACPCVAAGKVAARVGWVPLRMCCGAASSRRATFWRVALLTAPLLLLPPVLFRASNHYLERSFRVPEVQQRYASFARGTSCPPSTAAAMFVHDTMAVLGREAALRACTSACAALRDCTAVRSFAERDGGGKLLLGHRCELHGVAALVVALVGSRDHLASAAIDPSTLVELDAAQGTACGARDEPEACCLRKAAPASGEPSRGGLDRPLAMACWGLAVACSLTFVLVLCALGARVRRHEGAADAEKGGAGAQGVVDGACALCCGACALLSMYRRVGSLGGVRRRV
jgi:hypothetical protein